MRIGMMKRLLHMIKEPNHNESNFKSLLSTLKILIRENLTGEDFIKFGQFMVSLLPDSISDERLISLQDTANPITYRIRLRKKLFDIIDEIVSLHGSQCTDKSINFQEWTILKDDL